jgi:two-component system OmpR family response regulator
VLDERLKLRRDLERYRLLRGDISHPTLITLLEEMIAEAEALLVRLNGVPRIDAAVLRVHGSPPRIGGWRLDARRRTATSPTGKHARLTKGEFELLVVLMTHAGQVLSRSELIVLSRHRLSDASERTVDVLVSRLRRQLEADRKHPGLIQTVRGEGYILMP